MRSLSFFLLLFCVVWPLQARDDDVLPADGFASWDVAVVIGTIAEGVVERVDFVSRTVRVDAVSYPLSEDVVVFDGAEELEKSRLRSGLNVILGGEDGLVTQIWVLRGRL